MTGCVPLEDDPLLPAQRSLVVVVLGVVVVPLIVNQSKTPQLTHGRPLIS